ncbi:MAG TPA: hypothetical protein VGM08_02235 [Candidatus Saccharimonadales bacterium]|jgi:hypothetical protein
MKKSQQSESGFSAVEGLLIFVALAIVGFTGYFVYHARLSAHKTLDETNKTASSVSSTASSKKGATSKQQQQKWDTYTDNALGFSFMYPDTLISGSGAYCTTSNYVYDDYGNKVPSQTSYRPAQGVVPTTVIRDGDTVYVTDTYTYQLTGEHGDSAGHAFYSGCSKMVTTVDMAKAYTSTVSDGVLLDLLEFKIDPTTKTAQRIYPTQSCALYAGWDTGTCQDSAIVDSVKFQ